jgi:hypothetical protein
VRDRFFPAQSSDEAEARVGPLPSGNG